jgi:hypothetical protein
VIPLMTAVSAASISWTSVVNLRRTVDEPLAVVLRFVLSPRRSVSSLTRADAGRYACRGEADQGGMHEMR